MNKIKVAHYPMPTPTPKGKRQVAALSKRQLGGEIGRNVLKHLSETANNISLIADKGTDPATQKPMRCSADDVRRYWTPEQSAAIDEFIANFAVEPEAAEKPKS
jgi:hypothetical protein